jgi:phosphatidate cytidylyltransferase
VTGAAVAIFSLRGGVVRTSALVKRLASAILLLPLFVLLTLRGPAMLFHVLVVLVAAAAAGELARMFERAGRPHAGWLAVGLAVAMSGSFLAPGAPPVVLALGVMVALGASVANRTGPSIDPAASALLALAWIGWLVGHAILLRALPGGGALVLFLVGVTWFGETAAYAVGSMIGRRKLAPVISPKKTVEGAVAQVVASVVAALVLAPWLVPGWSLAVAAGVGLVLGVVGQIGDLAESVIKRSLGTKDTGGLIPGHGGMLDRIDSLLFNAPVLYQLIAFTGAPA